MKKVSETDYVKDLSEFITSHQNSISFEKFEFAYEKHITIERMELEQTNIINVNLYNKGELLQEIKNFVKCDYLKIQKRIQTLKALRFLKKFPFVFEISQEYYEEFTKYLLKRRAIKQKKVVQFKNIKEEHIKFFQSIMSNQKTRNLTVSQKKRKMQQQFPNLSISRSTVYKIKTLSKRTYCDIVIKEYANMCLKLLGILSQEGLRLFKVLEDQNCLVFVLDQVGFGTKPLRKYGYSPIGIPAILQDNRLSYNLTCTAVISLRGVEMIQFFNQGGTRKEYFAHYFDNLLEKLKNKYPDNNKKFVFILDCLSSHKSAQAVKIMQDKKVHVLFTPSNTPQFSPIENMFGSTKKKLQDFQFTNKEQVAVMVSKIMFGFKQSQIEGFFKKTLQNMMQFWFNLDRNKIISQIQQ